MELIRTVDRGLLNVANDLGGHGGIRDDLVFIAADLLPLVIVGSAIWLFFSGKTKRRRERNQDIVLIGLAAVLIAIGIRYLIISATARPRPFVTYPELHHVTTLPVDPSAFPSGHSLVLFTFAGVIFFLGHHKKLGWALLLVAGIVACARVVAGVHYPTDIVGGMVIGLLLARAITWQSDWVFRQVR